MANLKLTVEQSEVVSNRGGTLLVSAAAGSGKTKVLVDRLLSRIIDEGYNLTDFLIITFTNAAAAELKVKISDAISELLRQRPNDVHLRRQLGLIQLAYISTVHSFCARVIKQFGYMIDVPADYRMLDDAERTEILNELLEEILEDEYRSLSPAFQKLTDSFGPGRDDEGLVSLVLSLFSKIQAQPYPQEWLKSQVIAIPLGVPLRETQWGELYLNWARTEIDYLLERHEWAISVCQKDPLLNKKYYPAYLKQESALKNLRTSLQGDWDNIVGFLDIEYDRVSVTKYPDEHLKKAISTVREDTKKLIKKLRVVFSQKEENIVNDHNSMAASLQCLVELTCQLDTQFNDYKRKHNVLDFNDQEHLAIQLLIDHEGKPTDVASDIRGQFCEIMVDEYQDSNQLQEIIYKSVASENDDNRFLVGDIKQSIYGFREAEPRMFYEKYQGYRDAGQIALSCNQPRKLVLSKNFRSHPEILAATNFVFEKVMSEAVGGIHYGERERLYPGREHYFEVGSPRISLSVLETGSDDEEQEATSKYQLEAEYTAEKISKLLAEGIIISDGENGRNAKPGDFAILLRSNEPIQLYRRALEKRGIPVVSDNGESIFDTVEVKVIINFLRVLDNPHQDIPLLAVLTSPSFRISNEQLAQLKIEHPFAMVYDALRASERDWARNAAAKISEFKQLAGNLSADCMVWRVIEDTGILDAYCAMENGAQRYENILSFYDFCRSVVDTGHVYLYQLLRSIERETRKGKLSVASANDGVTVTTIHKSKGLEYPIVFLCDLSRKFNFRELSGMLLAESEIGFATKIVDVDRKVRYPGIAFEALSKVREAKLLSEELRILYVAMTRPKDYLFMHYSTGKGLSNLSHCTMAIGESVAKWATSSVKCLGDWILLAALGRAEAGALFEMVGRPQTSLCFHEKSWKIQVEQIRQISLSQYKAEAKDNIFNQEKTDENDNLIIKAINWKYPYSEAIKIPSKMTATELKGRKKDEEISELVVQRRRYQSKLERPEFILAERALSPTEKGTAVHKFLQYADFSLLQTKQGVENEKIRMVDEMFLSEKEVSAINTEDILKLFTSEIGTLLLDKKHLLREYKFSILVDAKELYPELGDSDEKILLQGVIDAAIISKEGITVIDFKTDAVTAEGIPKRVDAYREQISTYKKALETITGSPVCKCVLYFVATGIAVDV